LRRDLIERDKGMGELENTSRVVKSESPISGKLPARRCLEE
jgi:hypothetical protein